MTRWWLSFFRCRKGHDMRRVTTDGVRTFACAECGYWEPQVQRRQSVRPQPMAHETLKAYRTHPASVVPIRKAQP